MFFFSLFFLYSFKCFRQGAKKLEKRQTTKVTTMLGGEQEPGWGVTTMDNAGKLKSQWF